MSQLTYWHVRWVIPAAVVKAALELGGGDVEKGLDMIIERGEYWMRSIALELKLDRRELQRIIDDLKDGLRVDDDLVEMIKRRVRGEATS
ncbi:MAG: hypothetical protein F7C35_00685 [Desulfurococcales archaeon]|nr:hypothetical protein [Desulfurococcales archaeon]